MSGILTVGDDAWQTRERQAARDVMEAAINSESMEVAQDNIVVRGLMPGRDLDAGSENGWPGGSNANTDHEWRQDWNSSGNADSYNEAYLVDSGSSGSADEKIVAFYGVTVNSDAVDTRQIRFRGGLSGVSGITQEVNIEPLENDEESRGLLPTDVIFEAQHNGTIEMWMDDVNDGKRILLNGWVAEKPGQTITGVSYPDFV